MNSVHQCDCLPFMREKPDKYYDLAVVDPQYGIGTKCIRNGNNRTKLARAKEYKFYPNTKKDRPPREYFEELKRISRNQIIFGANHLCDLFDASGSHWIVWNKEATSNFSDCELAYTSFTGSLRVIRYRWNGMIQGDHGDKRKNEERIHPSQKPVALYKMILRDYAGPGQIIFDSHVGSGSIRIACYDLGLDFEGCEIDDDYVKEQEKRFIDHESQKELFNKGEIQGEVFSGRRTLWDL